MLNKRIFKKINAITTGSVLLLILVGSLVRVLGAGMGCPDWPRCFGSYVPPTSKDELPDDYLEIFKTQRLKKNERLASTFSRMGYTDLASKITNDPAILKEQEFNVTKAWIEYINRLVGVLIGFLVLANMVFSFAFWDTKKSIGIVGFAIFVLTGFQGWVGSLVVSTNLLHGFITFHMLLALLILALLLWMNVRASDLLVYRNARLFVLCILTLVLFIPQVILGTNVRGIIDDLVADETSRTRWVDFLETSSFWFHRSYSWVILIGSLGIHYLITKNNLVKLKKHSRLLLGLIAVGMLAGVGMVKIGFPFWMQPLHLIVATGIFSILFYLTLRIRLN